jgi:phosphohistidine phosphatase
MEESGGLAPLDDPSIWLEKIKSLKEDIMIVGHLPHLSKLTTVLLNVDREIVRITNSGVLCLEEEAGRWIIRWYITPDIIG